MQLIPYLFALMIAFTFIIARLGSDQSADAMVIRSFQSRINNKVTLQKIGEEAKRKALIRYKTRDPLHSAKETNERPPRPIKAAKEISKFSLKFLKEPIDPQTQVFITNKLYQIFKSFYGALIDEDFFNLLLKTATLTDEEKLCNLAFSNDEEQKRFYKLLIHKKVPLSQICTLDHFTNGALFHYRELRLDLFTALFDEEAVLDIFEKEAVIKKQKQPLSKDKVLLMFAENLPEWSLVRVDRLMTFKDERSTVLNGVVEGSSADYFSFKNS